jgi:HKD family nuclease
MKAEVHILIQPYCSQQGKSILNLLIGELKSGEWTHFHAAVAFARQSGNVQELLDALKSFACAGGTIEITFGANTFGDDAQGSDYESIRSLLMLLEEQPNARLYLYYEPGRTFHPKLYLFANEGQRKALVIIGSLRNNVEANAIITLDLTNEDHSECYNSILDHFVSYWREVK